MDKREQLAQFAKAVYVAILNNDDRAVLEVITAILSPIWRIIDSEVADCLGHELWLWVGLKLDEPEMAQDYNKGILAEFSEYIG